MGCRVDWPNDRQLTAKAAQALLAAIRVAGTQGCASIVAGAQRPVPAIGAADVGDVAVLTATSISVAVASNSVAATSARMTDVKLSVIALIRTQAVR